MCSTVCSMLRINTWWSWLECFWIWVLPDHYWVYHRNSPNNKRVVNLLTRPARSNCQIALEITPKIMSCPRYTDPGKCLVMTGMFGDDREFFFLYHWTTWSKSPQGLSNNNDPRIITQFAIIIITKVTYPNFLSLVFFSFSNLFGLLHNQSRFFILILISTHHISLSLSLWFNALLLFWFLGNFPLICFLSVFIFLSYFNFIIPFPHMKFAWCSFIHSFI